MASHVTLARRYAKALLELTLEGQEFGRVEQDLYGVAEAYDASPELRAFLGSPSFSIERKKAVLKALFGGKVAEVSQRFLELLLEKRRLRHIRAIAEAFDEANDAALGVAKATVTSFRPLEDRHREALVTRLQAFTARQKIRLEERVEEGLLGGLIVRIGDSVLDGSVRGRLKKLQEFMVLREEQAALAAGSSG